MNATGQINLFSCAPIARRIAPRLKVLVACEYSGTVRDAFNKLGHNAISCDILPTETPGPHYQGDIFHMLGDWRYSQGFDLIIAHPPCTRLCNSGVLRLYKDGKKVNGIDPVKWKEMEGGFVLQIFCRCNWLSKRVSHIS